jgi:hypothetical protein
LQETGRAFGGIIEFPEPRFYLIMNSLGTFQEPMLAPIFYLAHIVLDITVRSLLFCGQKIIGKRNQSREIVP